MRPVRLQLEGFTSFRVPQEIDFSDLQLFMITGATGSGKTSMLDAVTLSLFGQVPRAGKHDLKELISLGASEAKVELDFQVGEIRYRVARRIPRRGSQMATLERLESGRFVPEVERSGVTAVNSRLVEILGLDYKSFTTAVLLPQGAFAQFLKGDVDARRQILIRLLDLERFKRAGERAREKAKELKLAAAMSQSLLETHYGDVTKAALEAIFKQARVADKTAGVVKTAYDKARAELAQREEVAARREGIGTIVSDLRKQRQDLKELASTWMTREAEESETRTAVDATRRELMAAQAERGRARDAWKAIVDETGSEDVLTKLDSDASLVKDAEKEIERLSDALQRNEANLRQARASRDRVAARLKAMDGARKDRADELKAAMDARRAAQENVGIAREADTLSRDLDKKRDELRGLNSRLAAAAADRDKAVQLREEREEHFEATEALHKATRLRAGLSPGDLCPVCGASVAELPPADRAIESELARGKSAVTLARANATQSEKRVSALESQLIAVKSVAEEINKRLSDLGRASALVEAERAADRLGKAETVAQEQLSEAEATVDALKLRVAGANEDIAGFEATRYSEQKTLEEVRGRMTRAMSRLKDALTEGFTEPVEDVIRARRHRLDEATTRRDAAEEASELAEAAYRAAMEQHNSMMRDLAVLDGSLSEQLALLTERRGNLTRVGVDLSPTIAIAETDNRSRKIQKLQGHIRTSCAAAVEAANRLEAKVIMMDSTIRERASSAGIDTSQVDAETATARLDDAARNARQIADRQKGEAGNLQERLEQKLEIQAGIEEKRATMGLYEKVGSELKTNRFIGFLLDESLEDLAVRASAELQMISGDQYSLAASDNNTFEVVDHSNADESRSVVTLSGGETFLASLALALGLAQGIADIAGKAAGARLEAMFIDEGFGSLDPDSRHEAVEALERLCDGERMVGLITHVPELSERIPDGFRVRRVKGLSVVDVR